MLSIKNNNDENFNFQLFDGYITNIDEGSINLKSKRVAMFFQILTLLDNKTS